MVSSIPLSSVSTHHTPRLRWRMPSLSLPVLSTSIPLGIHTVMESLTRLNWKVTRKGILTSSDI